SASDCQQTITATIHNEIIFWIFISHLLCESRVSCSRLREGKRPGKSPQAVSYDWGALPWNVVLCRGFLGVEGGPQCLDKSVQTKELGVNLALTTEVWHRWRLPLQARNP